MIIIIVLSAVIGILIIVILILVIAIIRIILCRQKGNAKKPNLKESGSAVTSGSSINPMLPNNNKTGGDQMEVNDQNI